VIGSNKPKSCWGRVANPLGPFVWDLPFGSRIISLSVSFMLAVKWRRTKNGVLLRADLVFLETVRVRVQRKVRDPGVSGHTAYQPYSKLAIYESLIRTSSTILILFFLANFHHCSKPLGGSRPYRLLYSNTACGKVFDCLLLARQPVEGTYLSSNFAHLACPSDINR